MELQEELELWSTTSLKLTAIPKNLVQSPFTVGNEEFFRIDPSFLSWCNKILVKVESKVSASELQTLYIAFRDVLEYSVGRFGLEAVREALEANQGRLRPIKPQSPESVQPIVQPDPIVEPEVVAVPSGSLLVYHDTAGRPCPASEAYLWTYGGAGKWWHASWCRGEVETSKGKNRARRSQRSGGELW